MAGIELVLLTLVVARFNHYITGGTGRLQSSPRLMYLVQYYCCSNEYRYQTIYFGKQTKSQGWVHT